MLESILRPFLYNLRRFIIKDDKSIAQSKTVT